MPLTSEAALRKDRTTGLSPMQHRHFATIATIIAEGSSCPIERESVAYMFADRLSETNPNFDRDRFMRACGGED